MKKLNLGCGNNYEKDWINCDISKKVKADFYFDCGKDKFPFKDNEFDELKAEMILEHLPDYESRVHFLKEIHRVCRNNAKALITCPHFSYQGAWGDLQHVRPFNFMSLDYFAVNKVHKHSIDQSQEVEGKNKLFIVKPPITFGKVYKIIGIERFANKHKLFYEMFLYEFFPARDLHFYLEVVK
jgi:SAM-dependent methyltransferase